MLFVAYFHPKISVSGSIQRLSVAVIKINIFLTVATQNMWNCGGLDFDGESNRGAFGAN